MEIKILVFTIVFLFTLVSVFLLMREYLESKTRLGNVEKKNDDLETRVSKLEVACRKRIPYASADSILDAMAALNLLLSQENFQQTVLENAKAHLEKAMSVGTKGEK